MNDAKAPIVEYDSHELQDRSTSDPLFASTQHDIQDMSRMGKDQSMVRVFKQVSLLSFNAILVATWEWSLLANTQGLTNGGRAGLFWSYIWVFVGYGLVIASLAEMASMAPTAAGQYHWTSEFAPPSMQRGLSYVTGWLAALCWQAGNASGLFLVASMIQSLISMRNPAYSFPGWQGTLLVIPVVVFSAGCNIFANNLMPKVQNSFMFLHVGGFIATIVVLAVLGEHVDAKTALLTFTNAGGWQTTGLSLMIGQISAVVAMAGVDAAAHMAEEAQDAGLGVPRAMLGTFFINGVLGFGALIAYIFCIPSVDDALNDPSGFPFVYVLNLAMPPNEDGVVATGTLLLFILFLTLIMVGNISYQASTARQTFAFARDQGLPFAGLIGKINSKYLVPVNAIVLSSTITFILSLINIGNSAAFNAIISLSSVGQLSTYCISITCVLHRRIASPHLLPRARWSLGAWGVPVNAIAITWAWATLFWMFWPSTTPVNAGNFNWAPVCFVVVVLWSAAYYVIKGRKVYRGPVADVKMHMDE